MAIDPTATLNSLSGGGASSLLARTAGAGGDDAARKTAEEFEQIFLSQFLNTMFSGIETAPPFGGGSAEETWRELLTDEYAKAITDSGGIGIADSVYRELIALQEDAAL